MKKNNKQKISIIFISIFLFSMFFGFGGYLFLYSGKFSSNETELDQLKTSRIDKDDIKIAIYSEPNTTQPSYSGFSSLTNNYTGLTTLFSNNGYDYTELTTNDIYNHKLSTADFDVFIMVDNLPRENITNFVKEYWLGGGSILSFDSALSYLMYAGILIPESEGDENYNTYWNYGYTSLTQNISIRHPATKTYQVGDQYTLTKISNAQVIWSSLTGTSFEDDLTKLSNIPSHNNRATGIALEPTQKGGKVIQLPGTVEEIDTTFEDLILDSIQWLCPTPKARILFDLAHEPWQGVDTWDTPSPYPGRLYVFRDNLVNRSYLFDKHWSGNLTDPVLSKYDILIIAASRVNYTSSEIASIHNWVNNGGNLFCLGVWNSGGSFTEIFEVINDIVEDFDINIAPGVSGDSTTDFEFDHPITEGVSSLDTSYSSPGFVNYTETAEPLIGDSSVDVMAVAKESGKGRVVLSAYVFFLRYSIINNADNLQFGINIINWLSVSEDDVLVFTYDYTSPNFYQTPVAKALNELDIRFYLTLDDEYLNLSLALYTWDLVIIDHPAGGLSTDILSYIKAYVDKGGKLIMSCYNVDNYPNIGLWSTLGFKYSADMPDSSPIYVWKSGHPLFNEPFVYGANNFTPYYDYFDEGDLLEVYPNATALAGFTETTQAGNATIVLRNDGKTLYNGYLIDQFTGDIDDSTYEDSLELWIAEIYLIMNYESLTGNGGIPGFDFLILITTTISMIGIISIFMYRKKRNK